MNAVRYDAPRDSDVKVLTAATVLLLGGAAVLLVTGLGQTLYARFHHPASWIVPLVFLLTPVLMLLAVGAEAPSGYVVDDDAVRVLRRAGAVSIPLSSIREVRAVPPQATFRRIGGSGGWVGFYGEFRNDDLGLVTMYATRNGTRVLLVTTGRSYVLTPKSPEPFLVDLQARLRTRDGLVPG